MKISSIHKHTEFVQTLRAAYRSLIRSLYKVSDLASKFEPSKVQIGAFDEDRKDIVEELELYEESPSHYLRNLAQEVKYRAHEEFRRPPPQNTAELHRRLTDVNDICSHITLSNDTQLSMNLTGLIPYVLKYRYNDFIRSQRKAQHFISNNTLEFSGKIPAEVEKKFAWPITKYINQTNSQRESRVLKELAVSKREKNRLLRQYIKHLQMNNRLAVPGALAYTDLDLPSEEITLDKKIFGSTTHRALKLAYNLASIETFLVPEVEFNVNYHHYWKKSLERCHSKGEHKVAIRKTEAGTVSMSYLELPYPQLQDLKQVAMDVKNLTNVQRLRTIWESQTPQDLAVETQNHDGSYGIGWYKRYGRKSAMFPRAYHEDLATMEAYWEKTVDELSGASADKSWDKYYTSWSEPLNEVSRLLKLKLKGFHEKYGKNSDRSKRLLEQQQVLQQKMHRRHLRLAKAVERVHSAFTGKFVHDSVALPDLPTKDTYDGYVMRDDMKVKKGRNGVPLVGVYSRNSLGYVLRKSGLSHFKIGMRFKKKIDW